MELADFEKEKAELDKFYSEHKDEEEIFMKNVWDEYEDKKKNLEKFVMGEFKKLVAWKGDCKVKYEEQFKYLKIKIDGKNMSEKIFPQEIEGFKEKYFVKEIIHF